MSQYETIYPVLREYGWPEKHIAVYKNYVVDKSPAPLITYGHNI